jgi:hypothetical protein
VPEDRKNAFDESGLHAVEFNVLIVEKSNERLRHR